MVLRPNGLGDAYRRAHGEGYHDDCEHIHDLNTIGHGGRSVGIAVETNDVKIGEPVEDLEKVGQHVGQGEACDAGEDWTFGKVVFHLELK